MSYNKIILMGRVTRDIELRHTPSDKAVCDVGVAVDSGWGDNKTTCFVDCTAWGKTAEVIAKHLKKGDPIHVDGRLQQDQWEDKNTGQKRSKLKMIVENFTFCDSAKNEKKTSDTRVAAAAGGGARYGDDDIPFSWRPL